MSSSITSALSSTSSLANTLAQLKNNTTSSLLGSLNSSSAMSSLTATLCSGITDVCSLSAVYSALSATASAAKESGVDSDTIDNLKLFVQNLESEGTDTVTILEYLNRAKEIAKNDPDGFTEIFASSSDETDAAAETDSTDAAAAATETDDTDTE